ncbi:hypothetical protein ARMGADRAFT_1129676 [Armillaria gallica]|uniref:Uncharacterized protein n=1 Tax=Armillaria gallica TaxID=47427 RepID=A0A2H3CTM8_ARMGA|nr:hypothetical protein ARMGADRAFT_1129676 [Armillaria gallica]
MHELLGDAAGLPTKGAQNKFLSGFGLHDIQYLKNAFWNVMDCDPFHSLSWDRLHAHDDGLLGKHLRGKLVAHVEALGSQFISQADDQIKLFPCWRDFYHFESSFMGVHFTDGGKYEDLAKRTLNFPAIAIPWHYPAEFQFRRNATCNFRALAIFPLLLCSVSHPLCRVAPGYFSTFFTVLLINL